ncbi:MAG: VCBS repeat-containing protein [Planctomycetaceae bacterium]
MNSITIFQKRSFRKSERIDLRPLEVLEDRQLLSGVAPLSMTTAATGYFEESAESFADSQFSNLSVVEDFNGDSHLDVFLVGASADSEAETSTLRNELWLNDGDGTFTSFSEQTSSAKIENVVAANFDNDTDIDLLVTSRDGNTRWLTLWRNDGSGNFSEEVILETIYYGLQVPNAVGDVDGDLDQDIIIATNQSLTPQVYENDGTGHFSLKGSLVYQSNLLDNSWLTDIELGDVDGDNDLDAVISYGVLGPNYTESVIVCINDGTGSFEQLASGYYPSNPRAIEMGDLNGDGYLDLFLLGQDEGDYDHSRILFNDGQGGFEPGSQWLRSGNDLEFADVDHDGDLDLLVAIDVDDLTPDVWKHSLYLNDGEGTFYASAHLPGKSPEGDVRLKSIKSADFDGDGALDLLLGQIGRNDSVWFNTNKAMLPYRNNFEPTLPPYQGLILNSESTTSIQQYGENHVLQLNNSGLTGLSSVIVETAAELPEDFVFSSLVKSISGSNRWLDGFLIFDYQSETDFKYAGMFTGQNQWVIGHYQGNFSNRLAQVDWDDTGRSINTNRYYLLKLVVTGNDVQLLVDGEEVVGASFAGPVNNGAVGVAAYNAVTHFDNLQLTIEEPESYPIHEGFEYGLPTTLDYTKPTRTSVRRRWAKVT